MQPLNIISSTTNEGQQRPLKSTVELSDGVITVELSEVASAALEKLTQRMQAEQCLAGVLSINTDAPAVLDPATLLDQASALLAQAYGTAGDSFRSLLPDMQDNYLAAVSGLLAQARYLVARSEA